MKPIDKINLPLANSDNLKSNSCLGYSGEVVLKKYNQKTKKVIETKHIKNAGTKALFEFLCRCLANQFTANNRPRYIDAFSEKFEKEDSNLTSNLYYKSIISSEKPKEQTDSWCTIYSATILRGQLKSDVVKSLALCASGSADDTERLAWINIDSDSGIAVSEGEAIIIEWILSFKNVEHE